MEGLPSCNLTYRLIKDTSTRVAALEAGEVDIAELVPPLDMRFDSGDQVLLQERYLVYLQLS